VEVESSSKEGSKVGMKKGRREWKEGTNEGWMNGRQNWGTYMKENIKLC